MRCGRARHNGHEEASRLPSGGHHNTYKATLRMDGSARGEPSLRRSEGDMERIVPCVL
jgi:hypothetical protein